MVENGYGCVLPNTKSIFYSSFSDMPPTVNDTNQETADVQALLRQWEEEHHAAAYDPVPLLTRCAYNHSHI